MISAEDALRSTLGEPSDLVKSKVSDRLNELTRQFVERSPFLCLATSAADGTCDVSPRGDPAGFVRILDERTLLLPDRPGNRLADSLRNVLENPNVGLLFIVQGKVPKLALHIEIDQVFTHCSKAFLRARLWDPKSFVPRDELPSPGELLCSVGADVDAETYDVERAERYARREGFY
jgi:uncharacterized protein